MDGSLLIIGLGMLGLVSAAVYLLTGKTGDAPDRSDRGTGED